MCVYGMGFRVLVLRTPKHKTRNCKDLNSKPERSKPQTPQALFKLEGRGNKHSKRGYE